MPELTIARLDAIRVAMNKVLESVAKKYDLSTLTAGKVVYTRDGSFEFKVNGLMNGGVSFEAQVYEHLQRYHTKLPRVGAEFLHNNFPYKIIGARQRGKNKVIAARGDRRFFFSASYVENAKLVGG